MVAITRANATKKVSRSEATLPSRSEAMLQRKSQGQRQCYKESLKVRGNTTKKVSRSEALQMGGKEWTAGSSLSSAEEEEDPPGTS